MQFLKEWGSKCKDFEKFGAFYARFWKLRGLNAILQDAGFKMQPNKVNMHWNRLCNHMEDLYVILKHAGVEMQFCKKNAS